MPELDPTPDLDLTIAAQNADLLRRLDAAPVASAAALAADLKRDPSNTRKTIKLLQGQGLVADLALTDRGRTVLAGLDVATGRVQPPLDGPIDGPGGDPATLRLQPHQLRPDPNQPRKAFSQQGLEDLAASILREGGFLQNLVVRADPDAPADEAASGAEPAFIITAGERRWRAAGLILAAGHWDEIGALPCRLSTPEDEAAVMETALVENLQRHDLNHMEMGDGFEALAVAGRTNREIAMAVGRTIEFVQQHRRLTRLDPAQQAAVADGSLSLHDALRLLRPHQQPDGAAYGQMDAAHDVRREAQAAAPAGSKLTAADFGVPADWRAHTRDRTPSEGRAAAAEWLEPGSVETLSLPLHKGATDYGHPRAQIQVGRILGSDGWIQSNGYSLPNIASHGALDGVYSADTKAWATRDRAIAAAAESLREGLGRNLRGGVPSDIEAWLCSVTGSSAAPTGPYVVNGVDHYNATRAQEARYAAGIDPRPVANSGVSSASRAKPGPQAEPELLPTGDDAAPVLTARARLALIELAHKVAAQRVRVSPLPDAGDDAAPVWSGDAERDFTAHAATVGKYWLDQSFSDLQAARLIQAIQRPGGAPPLMALTAKGVRYLIADCGLPVSDGRLQNTQIQSTGVPIDWSQTYATDWLDQVVTAGAAVRPVTAPDVADSDLAGPDDVDTPDMWDRTPEQAADDAAALTLIRAFVRAPGADPAMFGAMLAHTGLRGPFTPCPNGGVRAAGDDGEIITVDVDRARPDDRADAIAELTAWALNRCLEADA